MFVIIQTLLVLQIFMCETYWSSDGVCQKTADKAEHDSLVGNYSPDYNKTWHSLTQKNLVARTFLQSFNSSVYPRRYLAYVPNHLDKNTEHPVILVIHQDFINAEIHRTFDVGEYFEKMAEKQNAVIIYANAYTPNNNTDPFTAHSGRWNNSELDHPNNLDSHYLTLLLQDAKKYYPISIENQYLVGTGRGGSILAQEHLMNNSQNIKAMAIISPAIGAQRNTAITLPPSIIIYSSNDPIYNNNYSQSMELMIDWWASQSRVNTHFTTENIRNSIKEGEAYTGTNKYAIRSRNNKAINFTYYKQEKKYLNIIKIINGGHGYPSHEQYDTLSIERFNTGFRNQDFHASEAISKFFTEKIKENLNQPH